MATTKKQPVKKKTTTKAAPKKTAPTRVSTKKSETMTSFQVAKGPKDFKKVGLTTQTVYWLVLAGVVLVLGLWVIDINSRLSDVLSDIDQQNAEVDASTITPKKAEPAPMAQ